MWFGQVLLVGFAVMKGGGWGTGSPASREASGRLLLAWSPSLAPWPWQRGACPGTGPFARGLTDISRGQWVSEAANCLCRLPECSSTCWGRSPAPRLLPFGVGVLVLPWSLGAFSTPCPGRLHVSIQLVLGETGGTQGMGCAGPWGTGTWRNVGSSSRPASPKPPVAGRAVLCAPLLGHEGGIENCLGDLSSSR